MLEPLKLNEFANYISNWRRGRSFYTPPSLATEEERDAMLGKLMLVVSEVAEAAEAVRHNDVNNFQEELADTFIRLLDICGTQNINIEDHIRLKMHANEQRPAKHGKHCSL